MLSGLIMKLAGMEKEEMGPYFPRPSVAGTERCIRQSVYWAMGTPKNRAMGDRYMLTMDDSTFHEYLTHDWLSKSAYQIHSAQMGLDILALDFIEPPQTGIKSIATNGLVGEEKTITIYFNHLSPAIIIKDKPTKEQIEALMALGYKWCKYCEKPVALNILHGHPDGIITDMLMRDRHYEHKALNHFTFEKYWKGAWPLDYFTQCCLNIVGIQKMIPTLNESILLIKNKNTSQYIDYTLHYDIKPDICTISELEHSNGQRKSGELYSVKNIVSDAIDRFRQINAHKLTGELPDRPYEVGTEYPCTYCLYEETCWAGYEKEYKALSTDASLSDEWITKAKYYLELGLHIKEMEKERDGIKNEIKSAIKNANASKATVGDYIIHNQLQESSSINKELIPIDILKRATKKGFKEVLSIRKLKESK